MKIRPIEILLFAIVLGCAIIILGVKSSRAGMAKNADGADNSSASALALLESERKSLAFDHINIQAKAAYVYDLKENKIIYAQNENAILPLASLAKIMTAVVAEQEIPQSAVIPITFQALSEDGDNGLLLNERWSFANLLNFTLTVSSNDGAHAIAAVGGAMALSSSQANSGATLDSNSDSVDVANFVSQMNQKARQLGLTEMTFSNPTGLDLTATTSGAYGSAKDVSRLFAYAITQYPNLFYSTTQGQLTVTSLSGDKHTVQNSNEVVNDIPGIIASKTGNTDLAGGNLVVAIDEGIDHPVIICLLGSSFMGRFTDMQTLASSTLAYFQTRQ
jgi:D-alanyl-D-alanine carboxypeptidase